VDLRGGKRGKREAAELAAGVGTLGHGLQSADGAGSRLHATTAELRYAVFPLPAKWTADSRHPWIPSQQEKSGLTGKNNTASAADDLADLRDKTHACLDRMDEWSQRYLPALRRGRERES